MNKIMYLIIPAIAILLAFVTTILTFIFFVPEKRRPRLNKFGKFIHDTVNFKYLIVEKILQFIYILANSLVIFFGIVSLFYVKELRYYFGYMSWLYSVALIILGPIALRLAYEFIMMFILLIKNVIQINNKLSYPEDYNEKKLNNTIKKTYYEIPKQEPVFTAPQAPAYEDPCGTVDSDPEDVPDTEVSPEPDVVSKTEPTLESAIVAAEDSSKAETIDPAPVNSGTKFCTKCGTKVDGGKFCTVCGAPIG